MVSAMQKPPSGRFVSYLRDIVFGTEDGLVSTLGALTGIAIGSRNTEIVLLAGVVVICVESISMAVGSFLSSRSRMEWLTARIQYELHEIRTDPEGERRELEEMYKQRGFPPNERDIVINRMMSNEELLLEEMMLRELGIGSESFESPMRNAIVMFCSYLIGGSIPLACYFIWPITQSLMISFAVTLAALFSLGVLSSHFSQRQWWQLGGTFLFVGGIAAAIGYVVGYLMNQYIGV